MKHVLNLYMLYSHTSKLDLIMYRHGRLSMRRKNETRKRAATLALRCSNECADQLPTTLVVSIDKSIWIGSHVSSLNHLSQRLRVVSSNLPQSIEVVVTELNLCMYEHTIHMYMYIYLKYILGWLQVGEAAFSRVEQDSNGMLHLSQSLIVDETMGWHTRVREICHYNHNI